MGAGRALLDPAHVEGGSGKVHLIPAQVHQLGSPQAMAVGHQDHGGVAVAPAVALGGFHELFQLGFRQVLTGAERLVGEARGCDCSIYSSWRDQLKVRFGHGLRSCVCGDCSKNTHFRNSSG